VEQDIKNLASAVLLQAAKDYYETDKTGKKAILKDLNSEWMYFLTDGMSKIVAEELKTNERAIGIRLKRYTEELN
jgi:hypothetical protein